MVQTEEHSKNKETADDLSLAFSTLFLNRTNRSGIIKAGVIGGKNQDGNDKMDCRFNKNDIINRIELIAAKASRIKVYNYDAIEFIEKVVKNTRRSLTFLIRLITIKDQICIPIFMVMKIMLN